MKINWLKQESIDHSKSNMNGTLVDIEKLLLLVSEAMRIVDEYDNDFNEGHLLAVDLYTPLTNDEKMWFNGQMRERTFKAHSGRQKQYISAFKEYL